ncbi:helix-turn-helix transcriptional regulator [Streptomyces sp. LX-29]|uniref:helix-turn-helix domain-containing protein n=1 Tax=Streptomyces sp. LX-29 TaxID=2900152 RepID=UPI00321BA1B5
MSVSAPTARFSDVLRDFRLQIGMTQKELADFSTLSVRAIRDLEHGRVNRPRKETIRLLAKALGLDGLQRAAFEAVASRRHRGGGGGMVILAVVMMPGADGAGPALAGPAPAVAACPHSRL